MAVFRDFRVRTNINQQRIKSPFRFVSAFREISFPVSASEIGITFTLNHFDFI